MNSIIVTHDNNLLLLGKAISPFDSSTSVYLIKVQLSNGISGCYENSFTYTSTQLTYLIAIGSNNNFGGISNTVVASTAFANVTQNDLCIGTIGLHEFASNIPSLTIDPNPSDGNLTIHFNDNTSEKTIRIFDVTGNIIYEKNKIKNSEEAINLTGVSKGVYFLKVFDENKISTNKIVIQ